MTEKDPVRVLTGRMGGHTLHAKYDSRELTAAARAKFFAKFYDQTDTSLPEPERMKRAEHLLRAYMYKLALKSAKARRERKARMEAAELEAANDRDESRGSVVARREHRAPVERREE